MSRAVMNERRPYRDHCNVCRRDVFICARCGKPSCTGGRTQCPGCLDARALDDATDTPAEAKATGATA